MFNRLLTNLPFNPSLINQVAFYSKRLKQETSVRRLGFLFMALTFAVQMFAVIAPPQPSLASSVNDIIPGGFTTHEQAVQMCDADQNQVRTILQSFGVSCVDVANGSVRRMDYSEFGGQLHSIGRVQKGFSGEFPVDTGGGRVWSRPITSWGAHCYNDGRGCQAIVGNSSRGPFMLLFACGNLVYIPTPPPPPPTPVKAVYCSSLLISQSPGSRVPVNTTIALRGIASGQNLPAGQKATFTYDYINVATGAIVATSPGSTATFPSGGSSQVRDTKDQTFKMTKDGHYRFRLAVTYDGGKLAGGSMTTECVRDLYVNTPPEKCPYNPNLPKDSPLCKKCDKADNPNDQAACIVLSKAATNNTQNINDANGTTAQAGDVITYTLTAKNTSKSTVKNFVVEENIGDILEYADVLDYHGGVKDNYSTVKWPKTDIKAGESISKQLTIKIKNPIPQTPASGSDPNSFDMKLTNTYGNTVEINLPPSIIKTTEQVGATLPNTGPGENLAIGFGIIAVIGYFLARSRLLSKELDLVRAEYGAGA